MDWFNTTIAYPGMEQRLEECDLIHMVKLKECQGALKVEEAQKKARGGGWFGGAKAKTSDVKPRTCNSEMHGLWQCRALALGCVGEVKELNKCRVGKGGECEVEQKIVGRCIMEKRSKMKEYVEGKKKGK